MLIAPTLDRYADPEAVKNVMKPVESIYSLFGKGNNLHFQTPLEINRMTDDMNKEVAGFYESVMKELKN
jgi:hypothetical protein